MPTVKLTEKSIARLRRDPSGKQALYWDSELKGFGVLVSGSTDTKSYIVQRALADGRRRRVTIAQCNVITLAEAVTQAKRTLALFYSGRDPKTLSRDNPTLKSARTDFLATRTDLRPKSVQFYNEMPDKYLADWLDLPLRSISRQMVEERLRKIAKDIAAKARPGYTGSAAANGAMRAFRSIYNYAAERAPADNPLPANPVKLKKVWLPVEPRTRSVGADNMKKFYDAVGTLDNKVAADYLRLVLFTGLRRGEAASLQWSYVDFDQRVLRLPASITKGKRDFHLPMSDYVHGLLKTRREAAGNAKWIFPANSKSGHIEELKFHLKQVADVCGVQVSPHDLRRSFLTVAESVDLSQMSLKALANHSMNDDVTSNYVQISIDRLREPVARVCSKLMTLCGITA